MLLEVLEVLLEVLEVLLEVLEVLLELLSLFFSPWDLQIRIQLEISYPKMQFPGL